MFMAITTPMIMIIVVVMIAHCGRLLLSAGRRTLPTVHPMQRLLSRVFKIYPQI
jgi:hypothetical protein